MKKLWIGLLACITLTASSPATAPGDGEWMSLFNGKNLKNWIVKIHHHPVGKNFGNTFRVKDGVIQVRYDQYGGNFNEQYGHLYYKTPFSHYHLQLEYRFRDPWEKTAPSYTILNSGLMFHSQDPRTMPVEQDWPISVEMQFLAGLGDGQPRPTGNMCSPGTNIVYEGKFDTRHCIDSKSKTYGKDEWVKAELIVYGDSLIQHVINGDTVLQYSKPSIGGGVANRYDPKQKIDGKALTSGFVALQSEGQPIDFRNIRIKKLPGNK
ncbi:3-keto-disaccharide hydrolase [Chitinophaga sp. NPDC101104]|uniref:3-keto-disaccharide hydrolase n=1 Tax=Chitinophaga sp. NPDC101104 TaxID=3390561 RepID=UPI003D0116D1